MKNTNWVEATQGVCILLAISYFTLLLKREGTPTGEVVFLSIFAGVFVGYFGSFVVIFLIVAVLAGLEYLLHRIFPKP
jgi:hypothetical protein